MPTATPLFTKRDPATGAVLFDFSGHIHAQGLDLDAPAEGTSPPDDDRIRFIRTADQGAKAGSVAYEMYSSDQFATLYKHAFGTDFASLQALAESGNRNASIQLTARDSNNLQSRAVVNVGADLRILLDGTGNSDFARKALVGVQSAAWPGGSQWSGLVTRNHGLTWTPSGAVAIINNYWAAVVVTSVTATQITLGAFNFDRAPAAGEFCSPLMLFVA